MEVLKQRGIGESDVLIARPYERQVRISVGANRRAGSWYRRTEWREKGNPLAELNKKGKTHATLVVSLQTTSCSDLDEL